MRVRVLLPSCLRLHDMLLEYRMQPVLGISVARKFVGLKQRRFPHGRRDGKFGLAVAKVGDSAQCPVRMATTCKAALGSLDVRRFEL